MRIPEPYITVLAFLEDGEQELAFVDDEDQWWYNMSEDRLKQRVMSWKYVSNDFGGQWTD